MAQDSLYLKWENHCASLYGSFLQLFTNAEGKVSYDDATIACDGKLYPVHRLVLSVCSQYFSDIFSETSAKGRHPVIILKDISSDIFEILLKFIYLGEVNIEQHKFHELMSVARCLKVTGLAEYDSVTVEANVSNVSQPKSVTQQLRQQRMHAGSNSPIEVIQLNESSQQALQDIGKGSNSTSVLHTFKASHVVLDCPSVTVPGELHDAKPTASSKVSLSKLQNNKDKQCSVNLTALSLESDFGSDQNIALKGSTHSCPLCNFSTINEQTLNDHVNIMHSSNQEKLTFTVPSENSKQKCKIVVSPDGELGNYMCPLCSHRSATKRIFQIHFQMHKGGKGIKCSYCAFSTTSKKNLIAHQATHTGTKTVGCLYCKFSSLVVATVKKHMIKEHPEHELLYCRNCPFMMDDQEGEDIVEEHTRYWHPGSAPYNCPDCKYKNTNKSLYFKHLHLSHFKNRKWLCSICLFETVSSDTFRTHVSGHKLKKTAVQAIKPKSEADSLASEQNNKTADSSRCDARNELSEKNFIRHFKKHTQGKKELYLCKSCEFCGTEREAGSHWNYHTANKKFKCSLCSYSSAYDMVIVKHMKRHHKNSPTNKMSKTIERKKLNFHSNVATEENLLPVRIRSGVQSKSLTNEATCLPLNDELVGKEEMFYEQNTKNTGSKLVIPDMEIELTDCFNNSSMVKDIIPNNEVNLNEPFLRNVENDQIIKTSEMIFNEHMNNNTDCDQIIPTTEIIFNEQLDKHVENEIETCMEVQCSELEQGESDEDPLGLLE